MKFRDRHERRLALVALLQPGYWSMGGAANKLDQPVNVVARDFQVLIDAGITVHSDGHPNAIERGFMLRGWDGWDKKPR
jgi:hypothetical protein